MKKEKGEKAYLSCCKGFHHKRPTQKLSNSLVYIPKRKRKKEKKSLSTKIINK